MTQPLSRKIPLIATQSALLFIDVQNFSAKREGAEFRDACDLGYLVTQVTDACLTYSQERHDNSLRAIKGYCRQRTTDQVIAELA